MSDSVSDQIAAWVESLTFDQLTSDILEESKCCWLDVLGTIVAGGPERCTSIASRVLGRIAGGNPQATSLADGSMIAAPHAAMINGIAAHVLDYDDTHLRTSVHPTAPVAAASLAVAEWKHLTGKDLILGLVAGVETECKVALSVPRHYEAGWHSTGTLGNLGSAAAASKLLRLGKDEVKVALGLAVAQASGTREAFGSDIKSFHTGKAASNGVLAALFASEGMTGPADPIGGRRGFASVFSTEFAPDVVQSIGSQWEVLKVSRKPYPCGVVIHPSIDGILSLRRTHALAAEDIDTVTLDVHPHVLDLTGITDPEQGLEGKFSIYYATAAALLDGRLDEQQFSTSAVRRPAAVELMRRVHARVDPSLARDQARVEIVTGRGKQYEITIRAALGGPGNPMGVGQIRDKFMSLTEPVLGARDAKVAASRIMALEEIGDARELVACLTPKAAGGSLRA